MIIRLCSVQVIDSKYTAVNSMEFGFFSTCHPHQKPTRLSTSVCQAAHLKRAPFVLHTYLVKIPVLKKTGNYDSSPALHIAEASVIEWPSGPSFAQFLMVHLIYEGIFFSLMLGP